MIGRSLKRNTGIVLAAAALTFGVGVNARAEAPAHPSGIQPKVVTLKNGLKLLLVERHEDPTVAAGMFYDVGAVNDPAGESGIAHLFEHMLFKGTHILGTTNYEQELPQIRKEDALRDEMNAEMDRMRVKKRLGEIDDVLDPAQWTPAYVEMNERYSKMVEAHRKFVKNNEVFNLYTTNGGAMLNAGTMHDLTLYFVQLPANKLELFFWIESDRMVNGVMREFYVERDNVREERRLRTESTPTGKYDESFEALFWQAHPYGTPVLGWSSEVESITRDDVRKFYREYYTPNNCVMVLVGDFDTDHVLSLAHEYFDRLQRGAVQPRPVITEELAPIAERRFYAEADTNPRVRIRFHSVAIGHKDEATLDVIAALLSGKTGRLYKRLVTEEEAALGEPRAGNQSRKYAGHFEINVTVKENRTPEEVEQFILEELDKLQHGDITDHELQKVKNQVLSSSVRRLQSNFGLMFQLGLYDTWYDWQYINDSPERMLAVTADDVHRVMAKYFDPKTRTVAIYRTKAGGAPPEPVNPELAKLLEGVPAEARGQIKAVVKKFSTSDDLTMLRQQGSLMQQALDSGQVPEDRQPILAYLVKIMNQRADELEAVKKESD